jgi:hypothetical protein
MTIGSDVKEVMEELGTALTIYNRDGTTVTGEYVDFETYPKHSTLFTRMFMYSGAMAYDSVIEKGDIVSFSGFFFIVTNKVASFFENDSIENAVVFFRCNVIGDFKKYEDTPEYDANYDRIAGWALIAGSVKCCLVDKRLTTDPENHAEIATISSDVLILYVSAIHDIKVGDRLEISEEEIFQVDTVSKYEIDNVLVCQMSKDDRG